MALRITAEHAEILSSPGTPDAHLTAIHAVVLSINPNPPRKITQVFGMLAANPPPPHQHVTQCFAQILCTRTPLYETIAMVLSDIFPGDISYNSVGSTRFATDVIVVDSGDDQRVQRWSQPLMEYDVAYGVRTMEQLMALISFFRAMRGRFYSFCYQDNVDFTSSFPTAYEARKAPPISALDQTLGLGDGLTYVWQLVKNYTSYSQTQTRAITRPQPGTTRIAVGGAPVTNWSVDVTTGLVTFTSPFRETFAGSIAYDGAGHFVAGAAHTFDALTPYVGRAVTVSGMPSAANNVSPTIPAVLYGVDDTGARLSLTYPSGYGNVAETVSSGLIIAVHPAPLAGATITAGYLFFVPVRFDTDILPVTIEDYGVGGSNSVKLIEVRSSDS